MLEDLIITVVMPAIIGACLASIVALVSAARDRGWAILPSLRRQSFPTLRSPDEALKIVIRFAQHNGYKISAFDEAPACVVLEESATLLTWGFLFQVWVYRKGDGSAEIEVNTRSKLIQLGPLLTRHHQRCVSGIRAMLFAAA
jgi:hypothetical protein